MTLAFCCAVTSVKPRERVRTTFAEVRKLSGSAVLKQLGVRIGQQVSIPASQLPASPIVGAGFTVSGSRFARETAKTDFSRLCKNQRVPTRLVVTYPRKMDGLIDTLRHLFDRANAPIEFPHKYIEVEIATNDATGHQMSFVKASQRLDERLGQQIGQQLTVWLIVQENDNQHGYKNSKRFALAHPVISQVVNLSKSGSKLGGGPVPHNLMKQIVAKDGTRAWWLNNLSDVFPTLSTGTILTIAIDSCHSATYRDERGGVHRGPSTSGLVAEFTDQEGKITEYNDFAPMPAGNTIFSADVVASFVEKAAQQSGVKCLSAVIVLRDGVAESQADMLRDQEVDPIRNALKQNFAVHNCRFSYVLVNKSGHFRGFQMLSTTPGDENARNPLERTIADAENDQAFYMWPADCNLSTSKPVKYHLRQLSVIRAMFLQSTS